MLDNNKNIEMQESGFFEKIKDQPKLQPEAVQSIRGGEIGNQEWVDHGIIDVNVADLPTPDGVTSADDFNHHIKWEDAKSATEQLPNIQEQVTNGKTREDFFKEDQQNGLDYAQGQERIYDLYYGSDPVTLDKVGDNYDIVSGRHRVFAAKELGLQTIPARVREKMGG